MNKILLALPIIASSILFSGCSSYSFRGQHTPPRVISESSTQYHLNSYSSDIQRGNGWSIVKGAGKQVIMKEIENELCSSYPQRFTQDSHTIPIDVIVKCTESDVNCWGVIPYFLTLGIYPANIMRYKDTCEVTVSVNGTLNKGEVKFRTNTWLSVWTPFGLHRKDSQDEYTGTHRHGKGIMVVPGEGNECFEGQSETYIVEIMEEINTSILKYENDRATRPGLVTAKGAVL